MNILLTTETYLPYITGVSVSTDNIARYMLTKGHKVTLVCPKPLVKSKGKYPRGLKLVFVPSLPFTFYNNNAIAGPFSAHRIIENEIKKGKFDVIHIQEPGVIGLNALSVARKYKVPTVGSLHFIPEQVDRVLWGSFEQILSPLIKVFIKNTYNKFNSVMTVSNFFSEYLKKIGVTKPINIISNGVDTNVFKPVGQKGVDSKDDFTFFYLGRLDRDKNVETIVRAMVGTKDNVKLLVVGKGTESAFLLDLAKKLKVQNKIKWVSYVSDSEMQKVYSFVNAFCIMSPYEGQSIVTLQAVSMGLPIIAANAGALPELVKNNVNGYLVDTYDVVGLSKKMNELAESISLRKRFGVESRKISLKHERSQALSMLEKLYRSILR
jgi:1,2-diacylglycerol 3-alpha-glucosyltransferase